MTISSTTPALRALMRLSRAAGLPVMPPPWLLTPAAGSPMSPRTVVAIARPQIAIRMVSRDGMGQAG
jgi:hypothetical protein